MNIKDITRDALMLALLIICSQISIPLLGVPLTMQTFAVGIVATSLSLQDSLLVISVYLVMGGIGLPVFSNFAGGISIFLSPLGGYLIGFIIYVILTGIWLKFSSNTRLEISLANLLGASVQLIFGTIWLKYWNNLSWSTSLMTGLAPFIIPGIIKIYLVAVVSQKMQKVLKFE
ncbi:biotin transport system substrate-specific component [Lactobacillus colini]|uniref:Biotin transporter n=1 Tax=Lactobacillus colini TaxID=1819254 RepID=A0ABS4ME24_9LACO|nr:biotin transporter BioY [Lactobacillus colini]MBP2057936.1 biotin transport system substrate-specific component [Lactobacillus colini]